jgi:hypothetical protein
MGKAGVTVARDKKSVLTAKIRKGTDPGSVLLAVVTSK